MLASVTVTIVSSLTLCFNHCCNHLVQIRDFIGCNIPNSLVIHPEVPYN